MPFKQFKIQNSKFKMGKVIDESFISSIVGKVVEKTLFDPDFFPGVGVIAAGTAKLVGTDSRDILTAAADLLGDRAAYEQMATAINPFGDGRAAERILQIVENYFIKVRG